MRYRVLWSLDAYYNLPILVHPRVPAKDVAAVQRALVELNRTPAGMKLLETSAALVQQQPPLGFVNAGDADYENVRRFYRTTLLRPEPP